MRWIFLMLFSSSLLASPGHSNLPYNSKNSVKLGSWVDIDLPITSKGNCFEADFEYEWEKDGAVSTEAYMKLVSNFEEMKKDRNLSLSYDAKTKFAADGLGLGGDSSFKGKYSTFMQNQTNTIALVFTAKANYGRRFLKNEKLTLEAKSLIENDKNRVENNGFRSRCGTHYVEAEQRASEFSVVLTVSNLDSLSKENLSVEYESKMNASISGFSASSNFKSAFTSFVNMARKVGTLQLSYYSLGGEGIENAADLISTADPSEIDKILAAMKAVSSSFSRNNSGIESYSLVPATNFGALSPVYSEAREKMISRLYEQLVETSFVLEELISYQKNIPNVYNKYFSGQVQKYRLRVNRLESDLRECVNDYLCDVEISEQELYLINDIFSVGDLSASCEYDSYQSSGENIEVLKSITINLNGILRFSDFLDTPGSRIIKFQPSVTELNDVTEEFSGFSLSNEDANKTRRIFGSLFHINWKSLDFIENANTSTMSINTKELNSLREEALHAFYIVDIPTKTGFGISSALGMPDITNSQTMCAAVVYKR